MKQIGFDNAKYLETQSAHIKKRIAQFGDKLYLEFGGKLFDDFHASRVLPGFAPDSKIRMLLELKDDVEMVISICASDIEKNKIRGDLGITYDVDVLRLIDAFRSQGLYVGSVVVTQYDRQPAADAFKKRLEDLGMKVFLHYPIAGYPNNVSLIVSDEGYGKNDYIETSRPLVVVTAPGPGSGKMATCLSQLYHEYKRGVKAGYAKFETFPIWNLPLQHPVNLAYEAATADLNDVNMIDPFHLSAYGVTTVNYNRDVEIFPVLSAIFEKITGECPYKSPTDMGVNMAGNCIVDDAAVCEAARQEIIRRYYAALCDRRQGRCGDEPVYKLELLMQQVKADCYCLLNSDVEVTPGWTEPLLRMMQDDDSIAACQPKLLSYCEKNKFEYAGAAGGYMDYLGYPFCAGRVFNNIEEDRGQYNEPREVFWASGATLVVRSELFHRFGGLDERFFAHMEEIDLCWRLKNAGYKICYNPESVVYHLGGGTLNKTSSRKTYLNFRNNLLLLHKNLPEKEKTKVFLVRAFLDFIAATVFLLQFKPSETKAVWTAHKDFRKMKKLYYGQISTIGEYPSCVCFRSIVFAAWISGKKCFNQLLDYIK